MSKAVKACVVQSRKNGARVAVQMLAGTVCGFLNLPFCNEWTWGQTLIFSASSCTTCESKDSRSRNIQPMGRPAGSDVKWVGGEVFVRKQPRFKLSLQNLLFWGCPIYFRQYQRAPRGSKGNICPSGVSRSLFRTSWNPARSMFSDVPHCK